MADSKIIVIDDDPTGCQTVHSCQLLTRWDEATLETALADTSPLFFILSNTRGMDADRSAAVTREICRNLRQALATVPGSGTPIFVSRSDSTLRGHYPVETDVMAEELGPFDAHFLVPAFFEGGRITRDSVHYLMREGVPVPVAETEFARDSVFGFRNSYLPAYVAERTAGRIRADAVVRFCHDDPPQDLPARLDALKGNRCCVVDAISPAALDHFAAQLQAAALRGKRFLFRSGASLITALAGLPPQPTPAEAMREYVRGCRPGAVIVGSHVGKTTAQLERLLHEPDVIGLEVAVDRIHPERTDLLQDILSAARQAHIQGKTAVIYTSRGERRFPDPASRLDFGERISAFLVDVVRGLPCSLGFLVSKGGITSNEVLAQGLALQSARVLGQILPGCSVVRCPKEHARFPLLPVVIFPGNVGDDDAMATVLRRLAA